MNKGTYSLADVATLASRMAGKTVGTGFCSQCLHVIRGDGERFTASTRFGHDEAVLVGNYARDAHQRRGEKPTILRWAEDHHFSIPKPSRPLVKRRHLPANLAKQRSKDADAADHEVRMIHDRVLALDNNLQHLEVKVRDRMQLLEEKVQQLESKVGNPQIQALPSPNEKKRRLKKMVLTFVYERSDSIDVKSAWSQLYVRFFHRVGDGNPPPDWYQWQLDHENKLDWFLQNSLLTTLFEAAGSILAEMAQEYPPNGITQQELGL